jgi:biopolymer transport protein ExbB/TolQ
MLSGTPHVLNMHVYRCGECAGGVSELFVFPAIGVLVASAAMLFHGILTAWGERFRVEMKAGSLQLMNDLVRSSMNSQRNTG